MNDSFRATLFLAIVCLVACQQEAPESRTEKIATAYCGCTSDLLALNKQLRAAEQDTSLQLDLKQLELENAKAVECTASIVGKYGKLNATEIPQVKAILLRKCPDWNTFPPEQLDNMLKEMLGE